MALSNETAEWLKELKAQGNLSDEQVGVLRLAVEGSSKADEFVKGSVLRQSDYSRNSAEIQKAKGDLEKQLADFSRKEADVSKFQADLGSWKAGAEKSFNDALVAREKAEQNAQKALARLTTVAAKYGVAAEDIQLDGFEVPKNVENKNVGSLTAEDVDKLIAERIGKGTQQAAQFDAMIQDISDQYADLYGKRWTPGTAGQLLQEATASGKPLSVYAADKFKFAEKIVERDQKLFDAKVKEQVDAQVSAKLSAAGLPGANPGFRDDLQNYRSPVLKEGGIPAPPAESGGGVSAAIAAFQGGKYAGGVRH